MKEVRRLLVESFDLEEMHTLCFDLGVNFESLEGSTIDSKARELIAYCQRQNKLSDLIAACRQHRPQVDWPDLPEKTAVHTEARIRLEASILDNIDKIQKQINILCFLDGSTTHDAEPLSEAVSLVLKTDEKLFLTLASFRHDIVAILRSLANFIQLPPPPCTCITFVDLAIGSQAIAQIEQVQKSVPTAVFILYTTPAEYEQCLQTVPPEWTEDLGHYYKLYKKDGLTLATDVRKLLDEVRETAVRKMELQIIQNQL